MLSRSQDGALLLGRLFVAALFLPSGLNKLLTFSSFAASLGAKGVHFFQSKEPEHTDDGHAGQGHKTNETM